MQEGHDESVWGVRHTPKTHIGQYILTNGEERRHHITSLVSRTFFAEVEAPRLNQNLPFRAVVNEAALMPEFALSFILQPPSSIIVDDESLERLFLQ